MAWPFGRKHLKTPFAKDLLAVREDWEDHVAHHEGIEEPNRIVVLSASAGATVALGTFGSALIEGTKEMQVMLPLPDGRERPDRVVQFAQSLDEVESIEAAYRVATWGLIAELGVFFWRPNYELEMHECAEAFEFRNVYEGEAPALGEPVDRDASDDVKGKRLASLIKGTLVGMIGAAVDEPIGRDDLTVGMYISRWREQYFEGLDVSQERLKQLAPEGLPIWRDED
jgi:hypothetical protein